MNKVQRHIVFLLAFFLFLFVSLVLRPISSAHEYNTTQLNGKIIEVAGNEFNKVIHFKLANDSHRYYINRRLENGVDVQVKKDLSKENVAYITYVNHWTPLGQKGVMRHVAKVAVDNQVIFTEME